MGQLGGIHHTDGHRIAMPPAEMLELFDGMAHRVPVVEEFTQTLLLQIGGDVVGLDLYRALNELGNHVFERRAEECRAVESAQFSCVVFEDMQDFGVADETGFGDFAETLDEDVIGQRSQRLGVGQHTGRRVERADEVLALRGVDAGFATGGGIDHGQQRGRAVYIAHAAHPRGSHETGQIGCGTAAKPHHGIGSGETFVAKAFPNAVGHGNGLAGFGIRNHDVGNLIAALTQQGAGTIGVSLHRLSVDKRDFGGFGSQHVDQMVHGTFANDHIIRLNCRSGNMHCSLRYHINHFLRCALRRKPPGMDMNVGDLAEYWVTLLEQFFPTGVGVAIEHGPASPTVRAFHGFRRIGIKVDHTTAMVDVGGEGMLGGWRHGSATAQRKDTVEILKHISDEIGLDLAECRLTVFLEVGGNLHAHFTFDLHIGIGERQTQHMRHFLTDTCFAGSHHADDDGAGACGHNLRILSTIGGYSC